MENIVLVSKLHQKDKIVWLTWFGTRILQ